MRASGPFDRSAYRGMTLPHPRQRALFNERHGNEILFLKKPPNDCIRQIGYYTVFLSQSSSEFMTTVSESCDFEQFDKIGIKTVMLNFA